MDLHVENWFIASQAGDRQEPLLVYHDNKMMARDDESRVRGRRQKDRHHEIKRVERRWRDSIATRGHIIVRHYIHRRYQYWQEERRVA